MKIIDKPNWPVIILLLVGIGFWTSIWYNGFLLSTIGLIVLSAIIGIYIKLLENR